MTTDPATPAVTKKPWESKTVWTNLILMALGLFIPGVKDTIATHPEWLTLAFGGINLVLRFITHGKIVLGD